jgi:glutamate/tyrosine decarboxylase-like PLP-dependent enzyme
MRESRLGAEWRQEMDSLLETLGASITEIIRETDARMALPPDADRSVIAVREPLPSTGVGGREALEKLRELAEASGGNTAGPRCFHFVIGGSTPAAHAADLMASAYDAIAYTWVLSPVAVRLEQLSIDWMKELFRLPESWSGLMVTGATMANFTCLAAARQWWGDEHGFDVSEQGLAGTAQPPVFSSGFLHASTSKVLALLGVGRGRTRILSRDGFGRVDLEALERELAALDGRPAIVVVNAGEVNAGEFDPVDAMVDVARRHNCWVHVDGAFGMFARVSPDTEHLVRGVERADSLTVDGHKWLNVPYDSGYAFVREHSLLARSFRYSADYLPQEDDPFPTPGAIGPESSRRARSFAVWATLKAYGREGHRRLVEHCLDLAQYLAQLVEHEPELELMNDVLLNIVAFRYNPGGLDDTAIDELNELLGMRVIQDGRFLVGTSKWGERVVIRPAFSNWRTRYEDVDEFARVVKELGRGLARGQSG